MKMKSIKKIIDFIVNVPKDKVLCFTAGYIIAHVVNNLWCGLLHPSYGGAIIGLLIAHIAGIVKEVFDYYSEDKHTPDVMDMVSVTIGGFISSIISLIYLI